jgi:hypothetical protein
VAAAYTGLFHGLRAITAKTDNTNGTDPGAKAALITFFLVDLNYVHADHSFPVTYSVLRRCFSILLSQPIQTTTSGQESLDMLELGI